MAVGGFEGLAVLLAAFFDQCLIDAVFRVAVKALADPLKKGFNAEVHWCKFWLVLIILIRKLGALKRNRPIEHLFFVDVVADFAVALIAQMDRAAVS